MSGASVKAALPGCGTASAWPAAPPKLHCSSLGAGAATAVALEGRGAGRLLCSRARRPLQEREGQTGRHQVSLAGEQFLQFWPFDGIVNCKLLSGSQRRCTHLPPEVTWAAGRAAAGPAIEAAVAGYAAAAVTVVAVKVRVRTAACAMARPLAAMAATWAAEVVWRKGWAEEAEAAAAAAAVAATARPAPLQRAARLAHALSMALAGERA